jgi:hypothetical protein
MKNLACSFFVVLVLFAGTSAAADDRGSRAPDSRSFQLQLNELSGRLREAEKQIVYSRLENQQLRKELDDLKKKVDSVSTRRFHAGLSGFYFPVGAGGLDLHLNYRLPVLWDRFAIGFTLGYGLVATEKRLNLNVTGNGLKLDLAFLPIFGGDIAFRLVSYEDFSIAFGPAYAYMGQSLKDPLGVHMAGGVGRILIGSLKLEVNWFLNKGKEGNYLVEPRLLCFSLGFNFL